MGDPKIPDSAQATAAAQKQVQSDSWLSLYINYWNIVHNQQPNQPVRDTDEQALKDHGSINHESILQLRQNLHVPEHPVTPFPKDAPPPTLTPEQLKAISSSTFTHTVLSSLTSEETKWTPEKVIATFGKNAAYIADTNGKITTIAILDPYTGKMSAYRTLADVQDLHHNADPSLYPNGKTPSADPNGFSAVAFVKLEVDDKDQGKYASAHDFLADRGGKNKWDATGMQVDRKAPEVLTEYGGFQLNLENWSLPGRLDRGEVSKQASRILDFNTQVAGEMKKLGLPPNTKVDIADHSLAAASGLLARFYWENNPALKKQGTTKEVTLLEPVAESEAVRQMAFLIAAEKNIDAELKAKQNGLTSWPQTDVETVTRDLLKNTILVVNANHSDTLHDFPVYGSADNNKWAGSTLLEIPFKPAEVLSPIASNVMVGIPYLKEIAEADHAQADLRAIGHHFAMNMAAGMLNGTELKQVEKPNLMPASRVAEQPKNNQNKYFDAFVTQQLSYLDASIMGANPQNGTYTPPDYFAQLAKNICDSLGLSPETVNEITQKAYVPPLPPDTAGRGKK